MDDEPINIDELQHNADWSKRTPDRWEDLAERASEEEAGAGCGRC